MLESCHWAESRGICTAQVLPLLAFRSRFLLSADLYYSYACWPVMPCPSAADGGGGLRGALRSTGARARARTHTQATRLTPFLLSMLPQVHAAYYRDGLCETPHEQKDVVFFYALPRHCVVLQAAELSVVRSLSLTERAVCLALAISLDNDYFSRHRYVLLHALCTSSSSVCHIARQYLAYIDSAQKTLNSLSTFHVLPLVTQWTRRFVFFHAHYWVR